MTNARLLIAFMCMVSLSYGFVEGRTFEEKLWEMELLHKGAATPFDEVEALADALLQEYTLPEEQARIYYQLAAMYAQSGPVCDATIRHATAAMERPLDPTRRMQLCVYWGDAIQVRGQRERRDEFAATRKDAAKIYLLGLKEYLDNKIPRDKPALPTWTVVIEDGPETEEDRRRRAETEVKAEARRVAFIQISMINLRDILMNQIVDLYTRDPRAADELEALAEESLQDSWIVNELLSRTKP